jgi:hypothetical protein
MYHVGFQRLYLSINVQQGLEVPGRYGAFHGYPREAQFQLGHDRLEKRVFSRPASARIAQNTDFMPGSRLTGDQIADMPKDAADRRAEAMDDLQGLFAAHA